MNHCKTNPQSECEKVAQGGLTKYLYMHKDNEKPTNDEEVYLIPINLTEAMQLHSVLQQLQVPRHQQVFDKPANDVSAIIDSKKDDWEANRRKRFKRTITAQEATKLRKGAERWEF